MKSLLKLFGAVALVTTPVVTIVACGSEDTNANPRDIQNSALALLRDREFKMTELGISTTGDLTSLQSKNFKEFSTQLQNNISTFLANELKKSTDQHPTQWYYDDAVVVVDNGTIASVSAFTIPLVNGIVNGHLYVKVSVTYKNLPAISKDIKLTFNNDTTTNKDKTNAMQSFIESKINNNSFPSVDVATLPSKESTDNILTASSNLNISIVPYLRATIKTLIQYQDLKVIITPFYDLIAPVSTSFFTIKDPTIVKKQFQFNGTLKNITISFNIGDESSNFKIADDKIAVTQSETNAVNQVSDAFYGQALDNTTLPTATDTITKFPLLRSEIINAAASSISNSYKDILATEIAITNESIATFTATDAKTGYFILNFSVTHIYGPSSFIVYSQNIKVTVSVKTL